MANYSVVTPLTRMRFLEAPSILKFPEMKGFSNTTIKNYSLFPISLRGERPIILLFAQRRVTERFDVDSSVSGVK